MFFCRFRCIGGYKLRNNKVPGCQQHLVSLNCVTIRFDCFRLFRRQKGLIAGSMCVIRNFYGQDSQRLSALFAADDMC